MLEELMSAAREAAEALMVDEVAVYRLTGGVEFDEGSGKEVETRELLFTSKCKFSSLEQPTPVMQELAAGESVFIIAKASMHLPVGAPATKPDDIAVVTRAEGNPQLLGREFRITGLADKTYASARR